jgi:error-prone DNA polymerase
MSSYVPLWCKSNYSFLEGASRPKELVQRAKLFDLPAISITDRDGLYGIVRAHLEAKNLGIKLIVGSQLTLGVRGTGSLVLLAQSRCGYANLCSLISAGRLRSPKGSSRINWEEVCEHAGGLIALWTGVRKADRRQTERGASLEGKQVLLRMIDAFGERLYLMLPRHRRAEEKVQEMRLRWYASHYGLPLVAAAEVLYHDVSRRQLQDVLTCIACNCTLDEAGTRLRSNAEHDLKSPREFYELYRDLVREDPGIIARSLEIAERCTFSLDEIRYRYPSEDLPDGHTSGQWLRHLTFQGANHRYGGTIPAGVRRQLEKELALIEELDYCGYFLTMRELVEFCRREGILCQGRGSAANSAVCYCLGITAVDPVRMELLFERFISRERNEPPDIDLDIEHHRREEVIQHVYAKYGRERASMVANFIRYRPRSAVRDVGRALGLPAVTLDRVARLLPHYGRELRAELERTDFDLSNRLHEQLARLGEQILDFPRHLSIHPGGFLLGSEPVTSFVPVENATMPGRTVIQWDKRDVEDMNLFKVDLLGLGALTHLDYCFRLLKTHRGIELNMTDIPDNDPRVFTLLGRADTVGVFQIESRAQMAMLPRLRPRSYYDLVIEISIVRPGPIVGGMVHPYLRRRRGEEPVEYPHPSLIPVLRKTLGVPLFQEQVMRLAMEAADYSPGEADQLRRDMAAWRISGRMERHRDKLISRMIANGISREFAERVYQQILGFGEYGFPESHAASFALIAYSTAWMKYHYPAEFTCALLNAWPMGFYAPSTIVEDARHHGVEVRPVDIIASDWQCTLERLEAPVGDTDRGQEPGSGRKGDSQHCGRQRFAVRMGLRFVKELGEEDWKRIREVRRSWKPKDTSAAAFDCRARLRDFVEQTGIDEDALAALAESGALRCFGVERRQALWDICGAGRRVKGDPGRKITAGGLAGKSRTVSAARTERSGGTAGQLGLFLEEQEPLPSFSSLTQIESIGWDYLSTGHSVQGHPLEPFREELAGQRLPEARELAGKRDGSRISYAGLVICRQRPLTAGGVVFMTLEDESGFVNLVVWSATFEKYRKLILTSSLLGVSGTLQSRDGVVHLIVESCWKPRLSRLPASKNSRDFH